MMMAIIAVFVLRLFQLQVIDHAQYLAEARSMQTKKWEIPAVRGEIYAMDGDTPKKIVLNETTYTLWADPSVIVNADKTYADLEEIVGGSLFADARVALTRTNTQYQVLAQGLTYSQANKIKALDLYGIGFEQSVKRVYPEGGLASQVLGFVNANGVGQYGVEGQLNDELAGKSGLLKTVTDVRDVPLTIGNDNISIPPQNGKNVVLTIDENVQRAAEHILPEQMKKIGATEGSILVMDPNNGHVLAMANAPSYNPNNIDKIKDYSVLSNPIISDPYEPASVMKTMTMSAGIDEGVMTPKSTYINTGQVTIDGWTINNASKNAEISGRINMQTVLTWSLNTGTVEMAKWLGGGQINAKSRNILYQYYHDKFRLGELTGIELQGESPGIVISPASQEGSAVRYANMTFGQGLDVTTLQVASAFSAVINGGTYHQPTVVAGTIDDQGEYHAAAAKKSERIIKQSTSDTMRKMIHNARQNFGYNALDPSGYDVGGKTGTAQTVTSKGYTFNQTTGTYIGYGATPGQKPAYVIMVYVAKPNTQLGGQHAAVVFAPMSNFMIHYLKLVPKG